MILSPDTTTSDSTAVTAASATFTPTMIATEMWLFVSTTNCWIAQGAAPTAAAADGNMFVTANTVIVINGTAGAKLAVIRDTADGRASLTRVVAF